MVFQGLACPDLRTPIIHKNTCREGGCGLAVSDAAVSVQSVRRDVPHTASCSHGGPNLKIA